MRSTTLVSMVFLMLAGFSAYGSRGGGGGVPSPFVQASNRKVELADGEMYTLNGKVLIDDNGYPFFWVDLQKHPWLANQKRVKTPFYRLSGSQDQWVTYVGRSVQLICIAKVLTLNHTTEIVLYPVWQAGDEAITFHEDYRSSRGGKR